MSRTSQNGKGRSASAGPKVRRAPRPKLTDVDESATAGVAAEPQRAWRNRIVGTGEEDAEQLLANPRNWRIHPREQQKALEGVLKQVGWVQNVIVNQRTGYVLDGHARVAMAISRGERVPVVYVDISEEEEALILATLDPLSAMAGTDKDLLAGLVAELPTVTDEGLLGLLQGLGQQPRIADDLPDESGAELQAKWKTKLGQIWRISHHDLRIGDALDPSLAVRCDGVCTDPPYELDAEAVAGALENYSDIAVMLCGGSLAFGLTWHVNLDFVWKRRRPRSFPTDHMPVLYHSNVLVLTKSEAVKSGWRRPHPGFGSIFETAKEFEKTEHGQAKTAELMQLMMAGFKWKTVADPFVGSGATILACEATGRRCVATELSPAFAAVTLERCAMAGLPIERAESSGRGTDAIPTGSHPVPLARAESRSERPSLA